MIFYKNLSHVMSLNINKFTGIDKLLSGLLAIAQEES